jgi:nucleotide-binding universal stress UspA family protein
MTRIVVGVDGSDHARRALQRAMEEARLRGGTVDAVYVYPPPERSWWDTLVRLPGSTIAAAGGTISPDPPAHHPPTAEEEAEDRAQEMLKKFVAEASAGTTGPKPDVVVVAAEHPAEALIEQSRAADLLVIGTRGYGGFAGMLLGSVAQQCIQRSRCPILVLPPEEV